MAGKETHPLARVESIVLIAIGGLAGSNLRYFTESLFGGMHGILIVNAIGSFVLGFVLYETLYSGVLANETRAVVSTGFLSSFTTYSTFVLQSAQAAPIWLALNVIANYTLGFSGVFLGRSLARHVDWRWS
ncbi:integral membrane protein [Haladaptatus paucihalophilus DX253]|uniref:Fluoride-specific ion channel FluC n=1 Tax=Haladaptatus paucihalophilus DX253 TaxID=797209 RepID=E7QSZ3_HALPU|nr:CrcB family protein [Haladaptatus paucihalophilus]EFW92274.1 integral membrane protein [Haladaptatus paucihalophilus DX253]SHL62221.1 camphor resistance protein CrcB [Haladaptatus paucihalophilus DX253]